MNSPERFDLLVIGAGPGGYVAALRAAGLGMKTACIEKEPNPGGVCLNVGCIPSKALLESTEYYHFAATRLGEHGIRAESVEIDLAELMERKRKIVSGLAENVRKLLEEKGVRLIRGTARLKSNEEVELHAPDGAAEILRARCVLLATGSEPVSLLDLPFDGKRIINSTQALELESAPKRFAIIGGGYIGLELGSVWARLGSEVTVIEMLPRIASGLDGQVARLLERLLRREGLKFRLGARVKRSDTNENAVKLTLESGGKEELEEFDKVLVAVGRRPLTVGLGIEELGIEQDRRGYVVVDEQYRTNLPGFYAIGDLIAGPMLAHKASAEGIAAVECLAGLPGEVDYDAIPSVVYTAPEVAAAGKTEEELKELGISYRTGLYPFAGIGRARCLGETDGFVKILAHSRSDRILGVHIIGPRASELIGECVLAIRFHLRAEDLGRTIHAHPTLSEAIHESAGRVSGEQ
ncbi:MAG: dihydrolipoyl dehydrogenase [Syntrophobacteraceae bacterium]